MTELSRKVHTHHAIHWYNQPVAKHQLFPWILVDIIKRLLGKYVRAVPPPGSEEGELCCRNSQAWTCWKGNKVIHCIPPSGLVIHVTSVGIFTSSISMICSVKDESHYHFRLNICMIDMKWKTTLIVFYKLRNPKIFRRIFSMVI